MMSQQIHRMSELGGDHLALHLTEEERKLTSLLTGEVGLQTQIA